MRRIAAATIIAAMTACSAGTGGGAHQSQPEVIIPAMSKNVSATTLTPASDGNRCLTGGYQPCERAREDNATGHATSYREGVIGTSRYYYTPLGEIGIGPDVGADPFGDGWWSGRCRIDPIDDRNDCSLTLRSGRLIVFIDDSGAPNNLTVFSHDFPLRGGAIRIDGHKAFRTNFDGEVRDGNILKQITSGERIAVRYYEWPDDSPKDASSPIGPISDALSLLLWARNHRPELEGLFGGTKARATSGAPNDDSLGAIIDHVDALSRKRP